MEWQWKKMETLKKVSFVLCMEDGYLPDLTDEEQQEKKELTKQRDGFFHRWIG